MKSMTAFAIAAIENPGMHCSLEIKSVNHRYLEVNCYLPDFLRAQENELRDIVSRHCQRGKVELFFKVRKNRSSSQFHLNTTLIRKLYVAIEDVVKYTGIRGETTPLDILKWPGVLVEEQTYDETLAETLLELTEQAMLDLNQQRQKEGDQLQQFIGSKLNFINEQIAYIKLMLPDIHQQMRSKLEEQLATIDQKVDPLRIEQEIVVLLTKLDITEELDRLVAHTNTVTDLITMQGSLGRKLDFYMQELNREANTLCTKTNRSMVTNAAVEIKVYIEQMREQIQNIE